MRRPLTGLVPPGHPKSSLAVLAAVVVLVAGCGGDDGADTTSSATTQATTTTTKSEKKHGNRVVIRVNDASPRAVLEAVLTSGDPELACRVFVTEHFVRSAYGDVQGCEAAVTSGGVAHDVEIGALQGATGGLAGVVVANGGPFDGQLEVHLVQDQQGHWLVASLESNAPVGP
jgi:hypothetical protein